MSEDEGDARSHFKLEARGGGLRGGLEGKDVVGSVGELGVEGYSELRADRVGVDGERDKAGVRGIEVDSDKVEKVEPSERARARWQTLDEVRTCQPRKLVATKATYAWYTASSSSSGHWVST